MAFTHLHVHSEYSLLDGSAKIKDIISKVKELGMDSVAITDHGVMYGVMDFYKEARNNGIKPIIGCEVYVSIGSRFDKTPQRGRDDSSRYYHLILLAENNTGYRNLIKIVSTGFVDGFYYKPRVDYETLTKYHEGIIASSACLAGEVSNYLSKNMYEDAVKAAKRYESIFGKGNFFLELQDHGIPMQKTVNMGLMQMSKELEIPLICTNDSHYINAEDAEAHDILLCLQTDKKVTDTDRMRYLGGQYYIKSEEEMRALFPYATEALENTHKIAQRCNVEIEMGVTKIPRYDVPGNESSWDYLNRLCDEGLVKRYGTKEEYKNTKLSYDELRKRLIYELSVISQMGFVDYFLIVWDFINYAKNKGIAVGPGRGSAAGSLVSYTLGITDIDPIKYDLLFERFLNPERVTMPDIDVDFCYVRRSEVIDYVIQKYGSERVAQIVTFGTLLARGVVRDVGRVLDMPYNQVDRIAKLIPQIHDITLDKALSMSKELKFLYDTDEEVHRLIDLSKRLEGIPRHTSIHAAGVLISPKAVDEYVPLSRSSEGNITTQYIMTTLEELGLLKMDFLGLRTLTVIQNACKLIARKTGEMPDMLKIDYNDKNVMKMLSEGKTGGVFQLESEGMTKFMKMLKPETLEDIIAGIALYRPGPMDFIPKYLEGKNNKSKVTYDCPELEPILKPTYGCIVYQEQVMQIVQALAGYTLGRSDVLRRAMSKKKASVMEKERASFVYGNEAENVPGCIKNGIPEDVANKIYDEMTDFASYAFNKSHAAAYAYVSFQTAYLKCYYPKEFMAALMTSVIDNPEKVAVYVSQCRALGIGILPPSINYGEAEFIVEGDSIRYGLLALKSIGRNVVFAILDERKRGGLFKSFRDFVERMPERDLTKRAVENFIKAGALDGLGANRRQLMSVYMGLMDSVSDERKHGMPGQLSLFGDAFSDAVFSDMSVKKDATYPDLSEYEKDELLNFEKEVVGTYVSGHPLDEYRGRIKRVSTTFALAFTPSEEGKLLVKDGENAALGGMITRITLKTTKTNKLMAFFVLEDLSGSVEVVVFPKDYEALKQLIYLESKVCVFGKVQIKETDETESANLLCSGMKSLDDVPAKLWVRFKTKEMFEERKDELINTFNGLNGKDGLRVYIEETKEKFAFDNIRFNADEMIISLLKERFGSDNVSLM